VIATVTPRPIRGAWFAKPGVRECRSMSAPTPARGLQPVPGTARGRGRIVVDLSDHIDRGTRRRAGVFRRALRREASRLNDPRRSASVPPLTVTFPLVLCV